MTERTIVYILSAPHSGSTLFDMMIGAHPLCTSLGEFMFIEERIADRPDTICKVCRRTCEEWQDFIDIVESPHFHDAAFEAFETSFLIDSSKNVQWIEKSSRQTNARVKIIRITRNGLATFVKTKRKKGGLVEEHILAWANTNLKIDKYLNNVVPNQDVLLVAYEELCDDIEGTLRKICDFLVIAFNQQMLEFWTVHQHIMGGNAKPVTMNQLYFNTITKEELHPDALDFFERYGFSVKLDQRYLERLSEEDVRVFNKYGGWLNARYGYNANGNLAVPLSFYHFLFRRKIKSLINRLRKKFNI